VRSFIATADDKRSSAIEKKQEEAE
jgi:hypothetical protein